MDDEIEAYRRKMQEKFYNQNKIESDNIQNIKASDEQNESNNPPNLEEVQIKQDSQIQNVDPTPLPKPDNKGEMFSDYEIAKRLQDMYNKEIDEDARARQQSRDQGNGEEHKSSSNIELAYRNYSNNENSSGLNENIGYPLLRAEEENTSRSKVYVLSRCLTIFFCILILALFVYSLK